MRRLFIVMDQPALVHAFPVLRQELPVRSRLYCSVVLFTADKAFHQSRLLIYQFCGVLFLGPQSIIRLNG